MADWWQQRPVQARSRDALDADGRVLSPPIAASADVVVAVDGELLVRRVVDSLESDVCVSSRRLVARVVEHRLVMLLHWWMLAHWLLLLLLLDFDLAFLRVHFRLGFVRENEI